MIIPRGVNYAGWHLSDESRGMLTLLLDVNDSASWNWFNSIYRANASLGGSWGKFMNTLTPKKQKIYVVRKRKLRDIVPEIIPEGCIRWGYATKSDIVTAVYGSKNRAGGQAIDLSNAIQRLRALHTGKMGGTANDDLKDLEAKLKEAREAV